MSINGPALLHRKDNGVTQTLLLQKATKRTKIPQNPNKKPQNPNKKPPKTKQKKPPKSKQKTPQNPTQKIEAKAFGTPRGLVGNLVESCWVG